MGLFDGDFFNNLGSFLTGGVWNVYRESKNVGFGEALLKGTFLGGIPGGAKAGWQYWDEESGKRAERDEEHVINGQILEEVNKKTAADAKFVADAEKQKADDVTQRNAVAERDQQIAMSRNRRKQTGGMTNPQRSPFSSPLGYTAGRKTLLGS